MEAKFKKEYILRTSDFDCNKRIHISSILDLFQDVAGAHATQLSCSGQDMLSKGLLWVLISVRAKVLKQPKVYDTVTVRTWPLEQKGIRFQREYKVCDKNGNVLILGTSKWVFIDTVTRRISKAFDVYPKDAVFCTEHAFNDDSKIPDFDLSDGEYVITPRFTHLDTNNHVNNIKYADFLVDAVGNKSLNISDVQIDYKSEILYNTTVTVAYKTNTNEIIFKGTDQTGQTKFTAKLMTESNL